MIVYGEQGIYDGNYDAEFNVLLCKYRKRINPRVKTFIINLQPYKYFMTPEDDNGVTTISGWSEGILRYIQLMSNSGGASIVEEINRIAL